MPSTSFNPVSSGWHQEFLEACSQSRHVRRPMPVEDDVFQLILDESLRHALGPVATEQLGTALALGHRGVLAARRGELAKAADDLACCSGILDEFRSGSLAASAGHAIFLNQQAYLHFARDRDNDAVAALRQAFVLDAELIEAGLGIMGMHQVQILTNLMRLHLRRGRTGEALDLATCLLLFLENGEDRGAGLLPAPWLEKWVATTQEVPQSLTGIMHAQVAREVIRALAAETCPGQARAWLEKLHDALDDKPGGQALMWCAFQSRAVEGAREHAFAAACGLLRRGPNPSEPFWLATILGVRTMLDDLLNRQPMTSGVS